jgi:hypothetical protein
MLLIKGTLLALIGGQSVTPFFKRVVTSQADLQAASPSGLRLPPGIAKGFNQITDSATFEPSDLIAVPKWRNHAPCVSL